MYTSQESVPVIFFNKIKTVLSKPQTVSNSVHALTTMRTRIISTYSNRSLLILLSLHLSVCQYTARASFPQNWNQQFHKMVETFGGDQDQSCDFAKTTYAMNHTTRVLYHMMEYLWTGCTRYWLFEQNIVQVYDTLEAPCFKKTSLVLINLLPLLSRIIFFSPHFSIHEGHKFYQFYSWQNAKF